MIRPRGPDHQHCCHLQRHLSGPVGQPVNLLRARYYGSILFRPHQRYPNQFPDPLPVRPAELTLPQSSERHRVPALGIHGGDAGYCPRVSSSYRTISTIDILFMASVSADVKRCIMRRENQTLSVFGIRRRDRNRAASQVRQNLRSRGFVRKPVLAGLSSCPFLHNGNRIVILPCASSRSRTACHSRAG